MRRTTHRALATALLLPTAVAVVAAAEDEPTATVTIERADVEVDAGTITVRGETSFTGGITITDDTGDAQVPGLGWDLESATIEQVDDSMMEFRLTVADLNGETVPISRMDWPISSAGGTAIDLWAWRSNAVTGSDPTQWHFVVATTSDGTFSEAAVDGELDGSTFVWRAPVASIGARAGDFLSGSDEFGEPLVADPIASSFGAFGALSGGSRYDTMEQSEPFVVGGSARLELYTAGGSFVDATVGKLRRGEFTAVLSDIAPGTYELVIIAEYADAFTEQRVPVTIA